MKKIDLSNFTPGKIKLWLQAVDQKTLMQALIAMGAFLIFLLLFFFPILMHNQKLKGQVVALKDQLGRANIRIIKIPEMMRQKGLFGARAKQVREQFFEPEDADKLIEIISTLAGNTNVRISASRPSEGVIEMPPPFGNLYTAISYELVIEAPYHNLGMFINGLEEHPKNFAVRSLKISAAKKDSAAHQCALIVTAYLKRGTQT